MNIITLKQAKTFKFKHFFTGKPCKHGHISKRFVINRTCCKCLNLSKLRRKQKIKQYYRNNAEYFKQCSKQYRRNNPGKSALYNQRRFKYLKESIPSWYETELVQQFYVKRDKLNKKWQTNFQVDHIIPILSKTVCGLHCWANLQLLDASVNQSKYNSYQQDW